MVTAWVTASDPWMTLLQPTCCNLQNRPSHCQIPHTFLQWTLHAGHTDVKTSCSCMRWSPSSSLATWSGPPPMHSTEVIPKRPKGLLNR
jgi:hypothetical protein